MPSTAAARSRSFRAARTTCAPCLAAILAVTSPIPLDAPVMTTTCSPIGFSLMSIARSSRTMTTRTGPSLPLMMQHAVGQRAEAVADAGRERFDRRLFDEVKGTTLVEHLG